MLSTSAFSKDPYSTVVSVSTQPPFDVTSRSGIILYHSDWHDDILDLTQLLRGARQPILHSIVRCLDTIAFLMVHKYFPTIVPKWNRFDLITTSSRYLILSMVIIDKSGDYTYYGYDLQRQDLGVELAE